MCFVKKKNVLLTFQKMFPVQCCGCSDIIPPISLNETFPKTKRDSDTSLRTKTPAPVWNQT